MTNERSKLTARVGAVVPLTLYILFGMSRGLVAQTLQIVSPADGTLVASGQTVSVTVAGDPSVLQSVEMASAAQMGNAPTLTTPPYTFSVAINPEAPSGLSNLTAMGNLLSGGTPQVSQINIDVERADRPLRLVPDPGILFFQYVGSYTGIDITGEFADGSRVILTHSTQITYVSDTPTIATVDAHGTVTSIAPGTATLTVNYGNASIGTIRCDPGCDHQQRDHRRLHTIHH